VKLKIWVFLIRRQSECSLIFQCSSVYKFIFIFQNRKICLSVLIYPVRRITLYIVRVCSKLNGRPVRQTLLFAGQKLVCSFYSCGFFYHLNNVIMIFWKSLSIVIVHTYIYIPRIPSYRSLLNFKEGRGGDCNWRSSCSSSSSTLLSLYSNTFKKISNMN